MPAGDRIRGVLQHRIGVHSVRYARARARHHPAIRQCVRVVGDFEDAASEDGIGDERGAVCRPVKVLKLVEQTGETCERREWQIDLECPIFTQDRAYIETIYKQPDDATT